MDRQETTVSRYTHNISTENYNKIMSQFVFYIDFNIKENILIL